MESGNVDRCQEQLRLTGKASTEQSGMRTIGDILSVNQTCHVAILLSDDAGHVRFVSLPVFTVFHRVKIILNGMIWHDGRGFQVLL